MRATDDEYRKIAKRLRDARDAAGLTNYYIADRSGVPLSTVAKVVSGATKNAGIGQFSAICNAIGISVDFAVYGGIRLERDETENEGGGKATAAEETKKAPTESSERDKLKELIGDLPADAVHALLALAQQLVQRGRRPYRDNRDKGTVLPSPLGQEKSRDKGTVLPSPLGQEKRSQSACPSQK